MLSGTYDTTNLRQPNRTRPHPPDNTLTEFRHPGAHPVIKVTPSLESMSCTLEMEAFAC